MKIIFSFATFISTSLACAGNDGSGGGDGLPEIPIDRLGIEQILNSNTLRYGAEAMIYTFMYHAAISIDDPGRRLFEKINQFGEQRWVDLAHTVPFVIESRAPCVDINNGQSVPTDAFADVKNNQICFSSLRLAQKGYVFKTVENHLAALFFHELAHFVGATEDEAQYAQDYIFFFESVSELSNIKIQGIAGMLSVVHSMQHFSADRPLGELCLSLGELLDDSRRGYEAVMNFQPHSGLIVRPYQDLKIYNSVATLIWAAKGYCLQSEASRRDYDPTFNSEGYFTDENGLKIVRVEYGNRNQMQENLGQVMGRLDVVLVNLRKSKLSGDCELTDDQDGNHILCYKEAGTMPAPGPLPPQRINRKRIK